MKKVKMLPPTVTFLDGKVSDKGPAQSKMWECSKQCKPLSDFEVKAIVCFRELPVEKVRHALAECDMGCLYCHYTKLVGSLPVDLRGHPIVCYSEQLRVHSFPCFGAVLGLCMILTTL